MERELWTVLYRRACELDDLWKSGAYSPYDASTIVGVYLWAVIWDRPTVWACDPGNWGTLQTNEAALRSLLLIFPVLHISKSLF